MCSIDGIKLVMTRKQVFSVFVRAKHEKNRLRMVEGMYDHVWVLCSCLLVL